ncbi:MAG: hypothetical protein WBB18_14550 [Nodosilinea sp.]
MQGKVVLSAAMLSPVGVVTAAFSLVREHARICGLAVASGGQSRPSDRAAAAGRAHRATEPRREAFELRLTLSSRG